MADKFLAKGTSSPVASGNMTPTNPASLLVNDILFCFLAQHDNVAATMPAGWTRVTNFPIASGTAVRHDCFWKRVTSTSESSASVTVTRAAGDAGIAVICAFRGLTTSGNPFNASATQANASSATVTMPTVTPSATAQTIIFSAGVADDGAFGVVSGSDPAPTERHDELTALGLDVSLLVATGERSVSTATGARTSTNARAAVNVGAQMALTTAAGGGAQSVTAGTPTVTTTAPAATVRAAITRTAGTPVVTVSAPAASVAAVIRLIPSAPTVTLTAPATTVLADGPQTVLAGAPVITFAASATRTAVKALAAGAQAVTFSAQSVVVVPGGTVKVLGAPLLTMSAPHAGILAGEEPGDDFWCGMTGNSGRSGGAIMAQSPGMLEGYR